MRRILALLTICLMLAAAAFAQKSPDNKTPVIILKDINGKTVNLSQYKGKIVLVNFWATWCPPCRAEIPELIKWQKEYQKQGLQIVGVTYPPTNIANVKNFIRRHKINYPILLGSKKTKAIFNPGDVLPLTVIIDKQGKIKDFIEGILYPEEFSEKIIPLLELKTGSHISK